jgi:hypothetical protein
MPGLGKFGEYGMGREGSEREVDRGGAGERGRFVPTVPASVTETAYSLE